MVYRCLATLGLVCGERHVVAYYSGIASVTDVYVHLTGGGHAIEVLTH